MTPEQEAAVLEVLDSARDMTVATVRSDGYPQATTVGFVHDGLAIYFGCGRGSQKAANIGRSDKVSATVNLPYGTWDQIRGVSLGGRARPVTEAAEIRRFEELMRARFPQVEDFVGADAGAGMCILRIDPEVVSLLDYRRGFGHTEEFRVR